MRKFRVVTDNLDWVPIKRGEVITVECKFKGINFLTEVRDSEDNVLLEDCLLLMDKHPEWFEEIKENEQPRQFNLKDMIDFGRFVYDQTKPSTIPIDMTLLDKWIQKAHPEDCVTKTKDSQKEEPKEYTEFDMRESFNAGINRGNYLTEEGTLSMKGKFPPFEYWLKSYKK